MTRRSGRERFTELLFYAVVLLVAYLALQVIWPFLSPLAWAGILALSLRGVYLRFCIRLSNGNAALVTTLLCGLLPAWRSSKSDVQIALRETGRSQGPSRASQNLRRLLVVVRAGHGRRQVQRVGGLGMGIFRDAQHVRGHQRTAKSCGKHRNTHTRLGNASGAAGVLSLVAPSAPRILRPQEPLESSNDRLTLHADARAMGRPNAKDRVLRLRRVARKPLGVSPTPVWLLPSI